MLALARSHPLLFWGTTIVSFLLSAFLIALDPIINNDGMVYTAVAERVLAGDWRSALAGFSLPTFPFLVALISKLSGLDTETSAYITASLFVCLTCLGFVAVVGQLSGQNKRIMLMAAIIILFLPSISKYRSFITRDFAYLACYFWALYCLVFYLDRRKLGYLAASVGLGALSANFRLEGILFAALIPFIAINSNSKNLSLRVRRYQVLWQLLAIIGLVILILIISEQRGYSFFSKYQHMQAGFFEKLALVVQHLNTRVAEYGSVEAIIKMVFEVIRRMAIVFFIFAVVAWLNGWPKNANHRFAIKSLAYFNIAILCVFSLISGMAISRYTMALVLTLLLLAPFSLNSLIASSPRNLALKISKISVLIILVLICLHGLNRPTDKHYLKQAGQWIANQSQAHESTMSNNRVVQFYANPDTTKIVGMHYSRSIFITLFEQKKLSKYAVIAYEVELDNNLMASIVDRLKLRFGEPKARFSNQNNRAVYIFTTR
jgi:predicted membrane-bound mannosyltransferase